MKLGHGAALSDEDRSVLAELVRRPRQVGPQQDLIEEGAAPEALLVILEGFACRYKILPDGGRAIVAYLLPGDFSDFQISPFGGVMDHHIGTLSPCTFAEIPISVIEELVPSHPSIACAFHWAMLRD